MATLIRLVSLSMGLHLCCLKSLALLQVWLCSRMSKNLSLRDVLALIKRQFQAPTCWVNVCNNHVFTKLEHFKGWQSQVDQIPKSSSPRGYIWHVDQVDQTPGRVGPGVGQPNSLVGQPWFEVVQPEPWLPRVYMRRRSPSRWRLLHPAGQPRGLADRPPPGAKPTSPSQWWPHSPL
jgi:hypothetical protein